MRLDSGEPGDRGVKPVPGVNGVDHGVSSGLPPAGVAVGGAEEGTAVAPPCRAKGWVTLTLGSVEVGRLKGVDSVDWPGVNGVDQGVGLPAGEGPAVPGPGLRVTSPSRIPPPSPGPMLNALLPPAPAVAALPIAAGPRAAVAAMAAV